MAAAELGATRLIGDSFRLFFARFGTLFPLALAPVLLLEAVFIAVLPPEAPAGAPAPTFDILLVSLIGSAVGYLVMAMICLVTYDAASGASRTFDAYLGRALRHLLPLFVLGSILSIAIGIALIAFIVPGLYVAAQFLVWVPAVVIEDAGMGALGRAQALTRGYRWSLVGAMLIIALMLIGAMLVAAPLFAVAAGSAPGVGGLILSLAGGALEAAVYALLAVFMTLVYLRLRQIEEARTPPGPPASG